MTQTQPPTGSEVPFGQRAAWPPPEQRVPAEPMTPGAWSTPGAFPPPGQPPMWPPPPAPAGQRRLWLWVVIASIAAIALVAAGGALLLAGSDTDTAGDMTTVIDEDFSAGTGAFEEFEEEDGFAAQRRDGAYEVTGNDGESTYWSSAGIDPSASVDISARLELVAGEHPDAAVGLSVEPNDSEAYFLTLYGDGTAALERATDEEEFVLPLTMSMIEPVDGAATLRLTVEASGSGTELTGWVDGEQVVRHVDKQGWDSFDGIGVIVATGPEPGTARADDVVVRTAG